MDRNGRPSAGGARHCITDGRRQRAREGHHATKVGAPRVRVRSDTTTGRRGRRGRAVLWNDARHPATSRMLAGWGRLTARRSGKGSPSPFGTLSRPLQMPQRATMPPPFLKKKQPYCGAPSSFASARGPCGVCGGGGRASIGTRWHPPAARGARTPPHRAGDQCRGGGWWGSVTNGMEREKRRPEFEAPGSACGPACHEAGEKAVAAAACRLRPSPPGPCSVPGPLPLCQSSQIGCPGIEAPSLGGWMCDNATPPRHLAT